MFQFLRFDLRLNLGFITLILVVAISFSIGCTKSSLKNINSLFGVNTAKGSEDRTRIADEISSALKGVEGAKLTIWHESYEVAAAAAAASNKPILADFTGSNWCHWCVKLKEDVFETEEFKTWAHENVVLLELDYPKPDTQSPEIKKQNADLAKKYDVTGYPTVLLLSPQGEVLGKLGYTSEASRWIQLANSMLGQ